MAINLMAPKGDKDTVSLAERVLAKLRTSKPTTLEVRQSLKRKKA